MTWADGVVTAAAAALIGALFAAFWQPPEPAAEVELRSGSHVAGRYPLSRERTVDVAGALGTSVVQIADGRARFVSSPCRNQVCVRSGWLAHRGDAAACLPNRVSLTLLGGADATLDAVSY